MDKKTATGINRRHLKRLKIKLKVKVTFETGGKKQILQLKSSNLSQQGICLEAAQDQAEALNILSNSNCFKSMPLNIEITLPPRNKVVTFQGKICWYIILPQKMSRSSTR